MDIDTLLKVWSALAPFAVLAITLFSQRRLAERSAIASKADAVDLKEQVEKLDQLENRVVAVEGDIRHLPDKDAAHRLELAMQGLNGKMETLTERMKPITAMAERIQDFAMEKLK